jgi:small subunit ribosomal protein S18
MAKNKYNKPCSFCKEDANYIDYKNLKVLAPFITKYAKIVPRYYSGTCLRHQKMLARAIKRARFMALIPFVK